MDIQGEEPTFSRLCLPCTPPLSCTPCPQDFLAKSRGSTAPENTRWPKAERPGPGIHPPEPTTPAASPNKPRPLQGRTAHCHAHGMEQGRGSAAHLSFLRSPRAAGLTAILGNVEAEVWDWLHEDSVSMLRGDRGGVLHSECDNEPAGEVPGNSGRSLISPFSRGQDQEGDGIQAHSPTPWSHCMALNSGARLHVASLSPTSPGSRPGSASMHGLAGTRRRLPTAPRHRMPRGQSEPASKEGMPSPHLCRSPQPTAGILVLTGF